MKKFFMPVLLLGVMFTSCSKDDEINEVEEKEVEVVEELTAEEKKELEIKDFLWKAMNYVYVYKSKIPQLADTYFSSQKELDEYLMDGDTPENFFYKKLVATEDRFSWVVSDYAEHEQSLQGSSKSAGFRYGFVYAPKSSTKVLAYVIYVSPDGPADNAGLKRGDYISKVNGTEMTINNYQTIFSPDNLELNKVVIQNETLVTTGDPIKIGKTVFKEKPIAIDKVFEVNGKKIGYLYLSSFLGEFEIDDVLLNDVFGTFKSENIDELIIDLRYNSGGYSEFSSDLASMVTGQLEGQIFTKQVWNEDWQKYWIQNDPEFLNNRFNNKVSNGAIINNLFLERVYVIGTDRSYSASESFIIGLEPHIEVVHVGVNTGGKFQGSYTIYDSEGFFNKDNINSKHKYAIQPLVYKFANASGYTDFVDGLTPDIEFEETIGNLGELGDLDEPLLARTIEAITGERSEATASQKRPNYEIVELKALPTEEKRGYFISTNKLPEDLPIPSPNLNF